MPPILSARSQAPDFHSKKPNRASTHTQSRRVPRLSKDQDEGEAEPGQLDEPTEGMFTRGRDGSLGSQVGRGSGPSLNELGLSDERLRSMRPMASNRPASILSRSNVLLRKP